MTTIEEFKTYCLSKTATTIDFPFDQHVLCFKVKNKLFALTNLKDNPPEVNLKCEPELADLLRSKYKAIVPGFHMNKKHWNTVVLNGSVPETELQFLIDMSYDLVVKKLNKADRDALIHQRS